MADPSNSPEPDSTRTSLELLYDISRELASDMDLKVVLRRVLLRSMDAVGSISGSLAVLDSSGNVIHSAVIHSGQLYDTITNPLGQIMRDGLAGWVAKEKKVVVIPDTSKDDRWIKRPDDAPDQTGPKSAMSVPLMARDELVGVLTLVHPEPHTFNHEHAALIKAIADQSGITVLNARLYEESRRRERAMTALFESSMVITASLGTEDILQEILAQVRRAIDVEAVSLALVEPDHASLTVRAVTGNISSNFLKHKLLMGVGVSGYVAQSGTKLIVQDTSMDDRYDPSIEPHLGFHPVSVAGFPIIALNEVVGTLEIYNPAASKITQEDQLVLTGIGSMAGSVIRYGQLFDRLQAAHRRFRELFDDSIDVILITDHEGNIRESNRRANALVHNTLGGHEAKNILEIQKFAASLDLQLLVKRLKTENTISFEAEMETANGKKWFQIFLRQIQLENEWLLQWILHDISERKEVDALRDDLISMIYHDLRSPLANVMYSLEMIELLTQEQENEDVRPLLGVATRATERIQRLTNSLLDIRLLEAGQPLTNLQSINAVEILSFAVNAVKPIALTKSQDLVIEDSGTDAVLLVDKDMLSRVLINLMDNAIKYTPASGKITTGIHEDPNGIAIWVEDNGPGIPKDKWPTIFNKYSRLDNTGLGFGLGLSFCRMAVEAHGGTIWIEDTGRSGSRFVISLPIQEEDEKITGYYRSQAPPEAAVGDS